MTVFVRYLLLETKNAPMEKMDIVWREHWFWKKIVGEEAVNDIDGEWGSLVTATVAAATSLHVDATGDVIFGDMTDIVSLIQPSSTKNASNA